MPSLKQWFFILVLCVIVQAATRYYFPRTQTKVVTVERLIEHKNVHTVVKTVVRPDGTRERVRETLDQTVTDSAKSSSSTTSPVLPKWLLTAGATQSFAKLPLMAPVYQVGIHTRVFGPFYAGIIVGQEYVGLDLAVEM